MYSFCEFLITVINGTSSVTRDRSIQLLYIYTLTNEVKRNRQAVVSGDAMAGRWGWFGRNELLTL